MGLDMYAGSLRSKPEKPVDFDVTKENVANGDLHYWRKHPNLHGWMEKLYREKGGEAESFNCVSVELTAEDLDKLQSAVENRELPPTAGFFFGASDGRELSDDLNFIRKARESLAAGEFVYYSSWW